MIYITVPGKPSPMPRPHINRTTGGIYYKSKRYADYKQRFEAVLAERQLEPIEGPVRLSLTFVGSGKKTAYDIDNACKAVMDFLNGHAYVDDNQVVELHAVKLEAKKGGEMTEVIVDEL